ncbi:MAG: SufD family Fe-S cluster assembly protein [Rickettsiales bacterium]|nr:SufD family Fe-S cluster assembly protein [Rickettsiales bacterium]
MQFLWEKFNIKTFPANTAVFSDGKFMPELSETNGLIKIENDNIAIEKNSVLPFHIIYVGRIPEFQCLKFYIAAEDVRVFFTAKTENKNPAFLQIFIENAGKNSDFFGKVTVLNKSELKLDVSGDHLAANTGVFVQNRVLAHVGSATDLDGAVKIVGDCPGCRSDMSFSAMAAMDIKYIRMSPNQRIAHVPESAEHSAGIYRGTPQQVQFLAEAGLSENEIVNILEQAFLEG